MGTQSQPFFGSVSMIVGSLSAGSVASGVVFVIMLVWLLVEIRNELRRRQNYRFRQAVKAHLDASSERAAKALVDATLVAVKTGKTEILRDFPVEECVQAYIVDSNFGSRVNDLLFQGTRDQGGDFDEGIITQISQSIESWKSRDLNNLKKKVASRLEGEGCPSKRKKIIEDSLVRPNNFLNESLNEFADTFEIDLKKALETTTA